MVFAMLVVMAFVAFAGGQEEQAGGETKMEGFNIAFSNGLVAHSWRTQMVEGIQNEVSFYQGKGLINDFHVQHAGTDVDLQVQHIRNFINMGVDALLVDALSISALNPIMEEAQESGILVVAVDMPVSSQEVWQVRPDHVAWIENMARYVFDEMNEEGDVVYLSGIDGAPVSDLRDEGFEKALADFPNINLLSKAYGNWDPSKARQTMESVLAAHSDLDGVVTQDGQAISVVRAFEAAGRPIPAMNGEYSREFVEYWVEHLDDGFSSSLLLLR
jgi:ribose transport system substrate-binding protein